MYTISFGHFLNLTIKIYDAHVSLWETMSDGQYAKNIQTRKNWFSPHCLSIL